MARTPGLFLTRKVEAEHRVAPRSGLIEGRRPQDDLAELAPKVVDARPFATHASYLSREARGAAPNDHDPGSLGPELSREFRGLKVWMLLQEHGIAKYARLIEQNVAQAEYLADNVHRHPELELMAPVPLNIVCLRYLGEEGSARKKEGEPMDAMNREILMRIQERGIAVPSSTVLNGRFAIRVAITNHRSRREDFDALVDAMVQIGGEVAAGR